MEQFEEIKEFIKNNPERAKELKLQDMLDQIAILNLQIRGLQGQVQALEILNGR